MISFPGTKKWHKGYELGYVGKMYLAALDMNKAIGFMTMGFGLVYRVNYVVQFGYVKGGANIFCPNVHLSSCWTWLDGCYRSLAACEQLYKAGYRNLFWLNGGFDAAQEGVLISVVCLPAISFCHKVDIILDTVVRLLYSSRSWLFHNCNWLPISVDFKAECSFHKLKKP